MLDTITEKLNLKNGESNLIKKAYDFALSAHKDQKRAGGEPYFNHVCAVAQTVSELKLDVKAIAAAFLHDSVEDTPVTLKDIKNEFGEEIAFLVEGLTKLDKIKYNQDAWQIENLRKMFLSMAQDIRVVIIKLADRLHNMSTLKEMPPEAQTRIAKETMEIYAPIADRLGMNEIKGQLEDLCFNFLYSDQLKWLKDQIQDQVEGREIYLNKVKPVILQELEKEKIKILEIQSRVKKYWSLWQKLIRYEMNWDKIHDLVALRLIVPTISDCYGALGVIHKLWRPLVGRIKDFIALPKPNGYQSLHTTVFCLDGIVTEIQIRTPQMHESAENGIAAHWAWEAAGKPLAGFQMKDRKLYWIKQLREWHKSARDSKEFLENLKIDFFKKRVFVFTPIGDVVDLPENATPIDFAYHIHTDLGDHCVGAKINGKLLGLDAVLHNGDVVEILTQKNKKPSQDWLSFVKTNQAKSHIKKSLGFITKITNKIRPQEKIFHLEIKVKDRVGMLRDITNSFVKFKINLSTVRTDRGKQPTIIINFSLKPKQKTEELLKELKKINGVLDLKQIELS